MQTFLHGVAHNSNFGKIAMREYRPRPRHPAGSAGGLPSQHNAPIATLKPCLDRATLWQQFKRPCQTRTDAQRAEVTAVCCQHPVDLTPLGESCHRAIDQSKTEILEFGVQFKCANEIRREGQFVLVTGCRIEDLGNELAHRAPSLSQEVVDFGEHQSWHEDEARRRQS